jgi:RNA-directed DNA polymerase
LNGLEKVVLNSIKSIVANDVQVLKITKKDGKKSSIRLGVKCVRYADDFVILARNKRILTNYIKPAVVEFLKERGLTLSEKKTKILGIRKEPLDFLGYRFKYHEKWRKKYSFFKEKIGRSGVAMYPNKEKLLEITAKIKELIDKASNDNAYTLITKLNPILRG